MVSRPHPHLHITSLLQQHIIRYNRTKMWRLLTTPITPTPPGRLSNKVAIVTGSSSGIGRAISLAYAAEGALLVCADLQPTSLITTSANETLGATHDRIVESGGRAMFVQTDVTQPEQVERLVQEAVREYGRLDVMVNNAGIGIAEPVPVWDLPVERWDRMQEINAKGVFLGIKYAAKQMISQQPHASGDRGWIINAASVLGLAGERMSTEYCAAKAAVVNMTRAAAMDCAPFRIHVNAFAPGTVETNMTVPHFKDEGTRAYLQAMHPFRGLGRPEDLAKVCVFLASEDAQWVSGVCCLGIVNVDRSKAESFRRLLYPLMVGIWQAEASIGAALKIREKLLFIVVYIRLASSRAGYLHLLYRKRAKNKKPPIQTSFLSITHPSCSRSSNPHIHTAPNIPS
jgi:NAD(P)-dependent dehydrogenase (short-subunit alcohol dehydrogenase family)